MCGTECMWVCGKNGNIGWVFLDLDLDETIQNVDDNSVYTNIHICELNGDLEHEAVWLDDDYILHCDSEKNKIHIVCSHSPKLISDEYTTIFSALPISIKIVLCSFSPVYLNKWAHRKRYWMSYIFRPVFVWVFDALAQLSSSLWSSTGISLLPRIFYKISSLEIYPIFLFLENKYKNNGIGTYFFQWEFSGTIRSSRSSTTTSALKTTT